MKNETLTEYTEDDGRLVSQIDGWWEVVTKEKREDGTDETFVTRVNKHSTKVRPAPVEVGIEMFSRQAKPTIIRPTKRIKPTYNVLNKKIRYSNSKPLQALMY